MIIFVDGSHCSPASSSRRTSWHCSITRHPGGEPWSSRWTGNSNDEDDDDADDDDDDSVHNDEKECHPGGKPWSSGWTGNGDADGDHDKYDDDGHDNDNGLHNVETECHPGGKPWSSWWTGNDDDGDDDDKCDDDDDDCDDGKYDDVDDDLVHNDEKECHPEGKPWSSGWAGNDDAHGDDDDKYEDVIQQAITMMSLVFLWFWEFLVFWLYPISMSAVDNLGAKKW